MIAMLSGFSDSGEDPVSFFILGAVGDISPGWAGSIQKSFKFERGQDIGECSIAELGHSFGVKYLISGCYDYISQPAGSPPGPFHPG
jgi:hypothetical protein